MALTKSIKILIKRKEMEKGMKKINRKRMERKQSKRKMKKVTMETKRRKRIKKKNKKVKAQILKQQRHQLHYYIKAVSISAKCRTKTKINGF